MDFILIMIGCLIGGVIAGGVLIAFDQTLGRWLDTGSAVSRFLRVLMDVLLVMAICAMLAALMVRIGLVP